MIKNIKVWWLLSEQDEKNTEKKNRVKSFLDYLSSHPFVKKNASYGATTSFYDCNILCWNLGEVNVFQHSNRPCPKFLENLKNQFSDIIQYANFHKTDDSCANELFIKLKGGNL